MPIGTLCYACSVRKSNLVGLGLMLGGAGLMGVGLRARRKVEPRVYAQAFPTMYRQPVERETEVLAAAMREQGLPIEAEWPSRSTYRRGAGPGLPSEVVGPVLIGIAFGLSSYAQGSIGQIGAEHSIAIRRILKEWLNRRKDDQFYFVIETPKGQQVRALCRKASSFVDAYDALDEALKQLPELPPNSFSQIEWDDSKHCWVQPL